MTRGHEPQAIPVDAAVGALNALKFDGPPVNLQQLDRRVAAIAAALDIAGPRARVLVSSVVIAQMLPVGTFVKGGIGVKLRLGEVGTRATRDVDVVVRDRKRFLADLTDRLQTGWGSVPPSKGARKKNPEAAPRLAFDGKVRPGRQAAPDGLPPSYVMEPYNVTLQFIGRPWARIPLEVAHDEIGGSEFINDTPEIAQQILAVGAVLGLGKLTPVPLISIEQQMAQKIHALTHPQAERAHDLVDLQLLWRSGTEDGQDLDLPLLAQLCRRTFVYRGTHSWPPVVALPALLEPVYRAALEEVTVGGREIFAGTLVDATTWLSDRIAEISHATPLLSAEG